MQYVPNSEKRKPLNCICWPVQVTIMKIKYFSRLFRQGGINICFVLCIIKIKFSFLKQLWMVDVFEQRFNIFTEEGKFYILFIIELSWNIGRILTFIYRQVIFFYVERIVVVHVMTFSELSVSSA